MYIPDLISDIITLYHFTTYDSLYKMCTEKNTSSLVFLLCHNCHAEENKNKKLLKVSVLFNVFDNIFPIFLIVLQTYPPNAVPIATTP